MKENRPVINFSALPMAEIYLILRNLGGGLLEAVLHGRERPELSSFLLERDVLTFSKSKVWETPLHRRLLQIPKHLRVNLANGLKEPISSAWSGSLSAEQWRLRTRDRLAYALGASPFHILPDAFWPLATHMAWEDPMFCHQYAGLVVGILKKEPPLINGLVPHISFSPITFQVLILLAANKQPFSISLSGQRALVRITNRLRQGSAMMVSENQWAGFWDQWLIVRALRYWPEGAEELAPSLRRILARLPLLDNTLLTGRRRGIWERIKCYPLKRQCLNIADKLVAIPAPRVSSSKESTPASPNWRDEIPEYMRSLYPTHFK